MLIRDRSHDAVSLFPLVIFSSLLILNGCSSLNEKECRSADWRMIGYEDAISGNKVARLTDHRTACAAYEIAPNLTHYRTGYQEGLEEYCRPSTAFELGKKGSTYPSQCPDDLTDQLKVSYRYGRDIYDLNVDIRQTRQILTGKTHELKQAEKTLSAYKTGIVEQGTTPSQRIIMLEQSMQLSKQIDGIKEEIHDLNLQLAKRETQLKRLVSVLY